MSLLDPVRERAHLLLGATRLFYGAVALLIPSVMVRRLGTDPEANPAPLYPLRMFGVRTVVLGAELLCGSEETRLRSMRIGRLIHASDTTAAALAGIRGHVPARVGVLITSISAFNTLLAFLGSDPPSSRGRNGRRKRFVF